MIRTIIALGEGELSQTVAKALTQRGIEIRHHCQTGAEIIRAVKEMGGGVILCTFKLRDMTANELASSLHDQAFILVLGKGTTLQLCNNDDLFTMTIPIRLSELIGAVTMLLQMDAMRAAQRIPKRSDDARIAIDAAKALLMKRHGMTEPEAHRYLQQTSMKHSARMEDTARALLQDASS